MGRFCEVVRLTACCASPLSRTTAAGKFGGLGGADSIDVGADIADREVKLELVA